jgi:hypothetical protein
MTNFFLEAEAGVLEESHPSLTQLDVKFIQYGISLFGLTTNKEHKAGRLNDLGLRRIIEFLDSLSGLVNSVPHSGTIDGLPPSLRLERAIPFTKYPKGTFAYFLYLINLFLLSMITK